jgi:glycosyltransferase involved in cell wall biosynthesis
MWFRKSDHSAQPILSIGIMTHNEKADLERLFKYLRPWLGPRIELVIVDDHSEPETRRLIENFAAETGTRYQTRALNHHFARQRNFLKSLCRGRFILFLDPDEAIPDGLLKNFDRVATMMDQAGIDLCVLPRWNVLLDEHGAIVDEKGSFPDYQERLFRNRRRIFWVGNIHEMLAGYRRKYFFPPEREYALYHPKLVNSWADRALLYGRHQRRLHKYRKILFKRLGLIQRHGVSLPPPF